MSLSLFGGVPRRVLLLLLAAAVVAVVLVAARASSAGASGAAVRSVGLAPAVPPGAVSLGATPSSLPVKLDVMLNSSDPAGLQAEASAVSTPGSPQRGHYLTVAQFAARFGQSAAAIQSADAALRSIGLTPGPVAANHLVIPVVTTVGQAARSLGTGFESYRLSSGTTFFANTAAPRLPSSLASITTAVLGLNSMPYPKTAPPRGAGRSHSAGPQVAAAGPAPCAAAKTAATDDDGYTYNQLAQAYEMDELYTDGDKGSKVNVGLFEIDSYSTSDLAAFQSCYATSATVNLVNVDGGSGGSAGGGEAALDIDTIVGMAPQAKVTVYEGNDGDSYSTEVVDVYTNMFDANSVQVVSSSYGLCEAYTKSAFPGLIASENTLFEQAATEGMSLFAASGDSGSEGCERANGSTALATLDQSSQPFATAVGGTHLSAVGPAPTETVWNESSTGAGAGGGGISSAWAMPSWQSGPGVVNSYSSGTPCAASSGYCREVPDVSADADPYGGYIVYWDGGWTDIGGTSAATPLWAAMVADIISSVSGYRAGFLNPLLYAGAATESGLFNDITSGNNDYGDVHGGVYPSTAAYDMASGLGTPIAPGLLTLIAPTRQSIGFTDAPGTAAPPARLGLDAMTVVPATCSTLGKNTSSFSTPLGNVNLSPASKCEKIGDGWSTWSNGYTGYVYWDDVHYGASNLLTLTLPAKTNAFYLYAEPDAFGTYNVVAISGTVTSGPVQVSGTSGAKYIGFFGQTATTYIAKIKIEVDDDFAIGEFGIAT